MCVLLAVALPSLAHGAGTKPSAGAKAAKDIATAQGALEAPGGAGPQPSDGSYVPGEVLVAFRSGVSGDDREDVRAGQKAKLKNKLPIQGVEHIRLAPDRSVKAAVASLERRPEVRYAQPNYYRRVMATPNDPRFNELWGLNNTGQAINGATGTPDADIDAPEAWDVTTGSEETTVAVVDTGVAYTHPELSTNIWSNPEESGAGQESNEIDDDGNGRVDDHRGWDFDQSDNDPADEHGHGTHVAGTVGARGNDSSGITGVNWRVKLMPVRVLGANGSGTDAAVASGFAYAAQEGADVVNASLGGLGSSAVQADAVKNAPETLFVVAAGNGGADGVGDNNDTSPTTPCNIDAANLICVAATDQNDNLTGFSNYGAGSVDLAAPGNRTLSTATRADAFSDGFEIPLAGRWTTGGTNNTWARTGESWFNGANSLTDSPGASYANDTDSFAKTGALSTAGGSCELSYLASLGLEQGFDYLSVEASGDGQSWTMLGSYTGQGAAALTEDLSAFPANSTVHLRFRLVSDETGTGQGVHIDDVALNCVGSGYAYKSGTSMASPHVAGVAALLKARRSTASVATLREALLTGVDSKTSLAGKVATGGRLNAKGALVALDATGTPPVDSTPPETSITSGPNGTISQTSASFDFTSTESGGSFKCKLDAGTWESCTSPKALSSLSDGSHTFSVQAIDAAANADATPATRTFTVATADTAAPDTTLGASGPSNPTADPTPTFSFSSESGASFECRVDSAAWAGCGSPHTTEALADGSHTFEVRARDVAGNVDGTPASRTFAVDSTPPDTSISSGPSGTSSQTSASFAFTSNESGSFKCKLDAGTWGSCTSPKALSGLSNGGHTFSVQAIDTAGNADATPASRTFAVDAIAPIARPPAQSFVQPSGLATSTVPVKLSWPAGSDNATGSTALKYDVEQKTNTGAFTPIASNTTALSITRSLAQNSTYQFRVRSRDAAGNVSAWATAAAFRPIPYQETSTAIVYGGTWKRIALSGAFGGYVKYTSAASATATLTFTGKNVAVVMPKRSGLGSAKICIDSASCSTIGLGSTTSPRQVVYKRDGLSTASHKVTVTRASGRIDLDGFVVLR